ncbi:MAG TPA: efflux RND transporter permease subunit [Steroidobacteraceae bacterium]|jgi:multidrug efflux pump|nr:efflux RND transporter permease subunit [Steroidobacteraceae bacterium]
MILSEISIRRPVFATVLSLLLLILGVMAALRLPVREYPDVTSPVVNIQVNYRGANAAVIETRITQVLENEIAGIEGIDKLTSTSRDESAGLNIEFTPGRDIDSAANDVRDRVSRVQARLPDEADPPQINKVSDGADPVLFIILTSTKRNALELTDYAERYLVDRFSAVPGVATVFMNGSRRYAMRIWLDRGALAARQVAISDIEAALRNENVELPAGRIESTEREFTLRTETSMRTPDDFRNLVIGRGADGYLVRLSDVATVDLAAENQRSGARKDGAPAILIPIVPQSTANVLEVANAVKAELARIQTGLPDDVNAEVHIDNSVFILESMKKVFKALGETMVIVLVVIFLFLGSVRATLIPAATIPVSLFAAAMVMAMLGYSINTLTLLGAVLAIGLVVDDAIVVLESIVRKIEHGEPALLGAINGSKEIGFAVIATTLVLTAVFLPISYLQGNIGRLFSEFGIAVAAAVVFSALVALTLTPMMTSKIFAKGIVRGRLANGIDNVFRRFADAYSGALRWSLTGRRPLAVLTFSGGSAVVVILLLIVGWPISTFKLAQEFAPAEDRARVQMLVSGPEGSSLAYTERHLEQVAAIAQDEVTRGNAQRVITRTGNFNRQGDVSSGMVMLPLALWDQRSESAAQIVQRLRLRTQDIPGVRVIPNAQGGIGGGGKPVQIVLQGPEYREIADLAQEVINKAAMNPNIVNLETDYQERKPQLDVGIDRNKAADLGVSLSNVGRALETMLGSRVVTTFLMGGDEYNVLLQARDEQRASVSDLDNIYVRSDKTQALVPLASLVQIQETAGPSELRRFNRLRSVTISANLAPGYSLGEALTYMEGVIKELTPQGGVQIDYNGESRELKRSASGLYLTFGFALLIVYLVLAAQFESFVHPLVILASVPMALTGAIFGLWLFNSTINVFSQIGAVMLIGIASKNGILIVEFANQLRDRGEEFVEATIHSATVRLRPVLMTTLATAAGAIPLMIATGAGKESRQSIGATVFFGSTFAVALTLFVVPALYVLIARNTRSPQYISRLIEKLAAARGGPAPVPAPTGPSP